MEKNNLMLSLMISGNVNESKDLVKSILADKISLRLQEEKIKIASFKIDENKIADIMDTVRYNIGPIAKGSTITKALKDKTAKEVAKEHGLLAKHATKFVNDYCSSC